MKHQTLNERRWTGPLAVALASGMLLSACDRGVRDTDAGAAREPASGTTQKL
jgi:hypothetical protein